jgi:hypothetical protein
MHDDLFIWLFMHTIDPWVLTALFIGMALQTHPEQIINVNWGVGLAVEFFDGVT